jgi:hypothetical protein
MLLLSLMLINTGMHDSRLASLPFLLFSLYILLSIRSSFLKKRNNLGVIDRKKDKDTHPIKHLPLSLFAPLPYGT